MQAAITAGFHPVKHGANANCAVTWFSIRLGARPPTRRVGNDRVKIAYLVSFLGDPAVARRVAMLRRGGADVELFGYHRPENSPSQVAGVTPREIGQVQDNQLARRVLSILKSGVTVGDWARPMADADVILARNLDCLLLAHAARARLGLNAEIVYEMLDVHGIMLGDSPIPAALRTLERQLLKASGAVMTSSPAFERSYLARYYRRRPRTLLVENKVFDEGPASPASLPRPDGPPWRIGWFGGIRCKRSLECLSNLSRALPGLFEVHIRGRFANTDLGDVEGVLRSSPDIHYHGPYKYPDDLARIYGEVHFTWAIDFHQEGANSSWLLPNRLYEGGLYGAVPIALRTVETGDWLERRHVGLLVDEPLEDSLERLLRGMTPQAYRASFDALQSLDPGLFRWRDADCKSLVEQLRLEPPTRAPRSRPAVEATLKS